MPKSCEVKGCSWRACNSGRRRHAFPVRRPDIQQKWIEAIGLDMNWQPSKGSFVCGEHFVEGDYRTKPGSKAMMLKYNAVPNKYINTKQFSGLESHDQQCVIASVNGGKLINYNQLLEKEMQTNLEIDQEQPILETDENNVNGCNPVYCVIEELSENINDPASYMIDPIKRSHCEVKSTAMKKSVESFRKKPKLTSKYINSTKTSQKTQCNLLGRYLQKKMSYLRRKNKSQLLEIKSLKEQLEKFQ